MRFGQRGGVLVKDAAGTQDYSVSVATLALLAQFGSGKTPADVIQLLQAEGAPVDSSSLLTHCAGWWKLAFSCPVLSG